MYRKVLLTLVSISSLSMVHAQEANIPLISKDGKSFTMPIAVAKTFKTLELQMADTGTECELLTNVDAQELKLLLDIAHYKYKKGVVGLCPFGYYTPNLTYALTESNELQWVADLQKLFRTNRWLKLLLAANYLDNWSLLNLLAEGMTWELRHWPFYPAHAENTALEQQAIFDEATAAKVTARAPETIKTILAYIFEQELIKTNLEQPLAASELKKQAAQLTAEFPADLIKLLGEYMVSTQFAGKMPSNY